MSDHAATVRLLTENAKTEVNSCVKYRELGVVVNGMRDSFVHGEWMPFLCNHQLDPNHINRAMRIAKFLTVAQCEMLPMLVAERLIRKLRRKQPNENVDDLTQAAWVEYKSYRRKGKNK